MRWRAILTFGVLGLLLTAVAATITGGYRAGDVRSLAGRLEALLDAGAVDRAGMPPVPVDRDVLIYADQHLEVWHRVFNQAAASEYAHQRNESSVAAAAIVFSAEGRHLGTFTDETSSGPGDVAVHRIEVGSYALILHATPETQPGGSIVAGQDEHFVARATVVHLGRPSQHLVRPDDDHSDFSARAVYRTHVRMYFGPVAYRERLVPFTTTYLLTALLRVTDRRPFARRELGQCEPEVHPATAVPEAVWNSAADGGHGVFVPTPLADDVHTSDVSRDPNNDPARGVDAAGG